MAEAFEIGAFIPGARAKARCDLMGVAPYSEADGAKPVAEDFSYSSDNNHDWLTPQGLLDMLEEKAAR